MYFKISKQNLKLHFHLFMIDEGHGLAYKKKIESWMFYFGEGSCRSFEICTLVTKLLVYLPNFAEMCSKKKSTM